MALPQYQSPLVIDEYVKAANIEEACKALADGNGTLVAGGTDLWVQKDEGVKQFGSRLINIARLDVLHEVAVKGQTVRLGALVTMTDVLNHKGLAKTVPVLAATADRFASVQIRNAATVGGNIANASPAADFVIPLMCLDAQVELARWDGKKVVTRSEPVTGFFTGPGKSIRKPEELITAVEFTVPKGKFTAAFCKSGPRPALEIAIVSLGFAALVDKGTLKDVRIAYGAVAPTPIRCPKTEKLLEGKTLDDGVIAAALNSVEREITPISDVRSSDWYRQRLARVYLEQELQNAAQV